MTSNNESRGCIAFCIKNLVTEGLRWGLKILKFNLTTFSAQQHNLTLKSSIFEAYRIFSDQFKTKNRHELKQKKKNFVIVILEWDFPLNKSTRFLQTSQFLLLCFHHSFIKNLKFYLHIIYKHTESYYYAGNYIVEINIERRRWKYMKRGKFSLCSVKDLHKMNKLSKLR